MAFPAIDNTRVNAAKHIDDWYAAEVVAGKEVPYASLAAAYAAIPSAVRMKGRSFLVSENGTSVEYWFKDNLTVAEVKNDGVQSTVYAWRYGIVGDGTTDDTNALNNMVSSITDNSTIVFKKDSIINFTNWNIVGKKFIKLSGEGVIFKGTVIVGDTNPAASVFVYNFSAKDIIFDHTSGKRNCFEFANCQGFSLDGIKAVGAWNTGSGAIAYIRPIDKFQHVSRCSISGTTGFADYLLYADNPINVAPYAGIQMSLGDVTLIGNKGLECKINNILGFGIDGILSMGNTHFMTSNFFRSQVKNQNIRLVGCNFIRIIGDALFEAGLEGVLLERCRDFTITGGTQVVWSGQRDVNFGWGIRVTGKGYTNVNYTTSAISGLIINAPSRGDIKLDEGCQRIIASNCMCISEGNGQFYYGTSVYIPGVQNGADPNALPGINSVSHYAVETHPDVRWSSINNIVSDNSSFLFGFDESLNIPDRELLIHFNNSGNGGTFETQSNGVLSIPASGNINVNGKNNLILDVANGVIKGFTNTRVGEVIYIYSRNATGFTIENNASIQLSTNANSLIPRYTTITLQKRVDKWYEINRSSILPVTPQTLSVSGAAGTSRDINYQTNGNTRWADRVNASAETGSDAGSDREFIARTDAGSLKGIAGRIYRATMNWHIGDIAADIITSLFTVNSVTKGSLPFPRMNSTQRNLITSPAAGLMIDNLDQNRIQRYNATTATWEDVKEVKGAIVNKVSNYTMQVSDYGANGMATVFLDATGAPFTLTLLPSATDLGYTTKVVKTDSTPNAITVKGSGTELINNANTDTTLSTQYTSFILESNGTKHFKF